MLRLESRVTMWYHRSMRSKKLEKEFESHINPPDARTVINMNREISNYME